MMTSGQFCQRMMTKNKCYRMNWGRIWRRISRQFWDCTLILESNKDLQCSSRNHQVSGM